jgi:hypothetical protein
MTWILDFSLPRFHHVLVRLRYVWTGDIRSPDRLFSCYADTRCLLLPLHFIVTYDIEHLAPLRGLDLKDRS